MRKIIITLAILVVTGVIAYFLLQNKSNHMEKVTVKSDGYEKAFDHALNFFNKHAQLIFDEENFYFYHDAVHPNLRSEVPNQDLTVGIYQDRAIGVEDRYKELEPYVFDDDMEGVIGVLDEKKNDQVAFFQTNSEDGNHLTISMDDRTDKDALKEALEDFELKAGKTYTRDKLEEILDMDFSDLSVLNIDDDQIKVKQMGFSSEKGQGQIQITYKLTIISDDNTGNLIIRRDQGQTIEHVKKLETKKGMTIMFNDNLYDSYTWKKGDYIYTFDVFNLSDDMTEDDILSFIDKSNAQFLP